VIEPLSYDELTTVVSHMYPELSIIAAKCVETFRMLREDHSSLLSAVTLTGSSKSAASLTSSSSSSSTRSTNTASTATDIAMDPATLLADMGATGRFLSTRDLLKWCHRVEALRGDQRIRQVTTLQLKETVFSEAADCFCGISSSERLQRAQLHAIGYHWGLAESSVHHYLTHRKPVIASGEQTLTVGRVKLPLCMQPGRRTRATSNTPQSRFGLTKAATCNLERLAVCVHLRESVLLVGETGTGKTTIVQYLASELGRTLVVQNMSQQSESMGR
jgi:midasin